MKISDEKLEKLVETLQKNKLSSIRYKVDQEEIEITRAGLTNILTSGPNDALPVKVEDSDYEGNEQIIKSPIIGTYYCSPSPNKSAFVKKGDKIKKGTVVCIIESMKIMHEIVSEFSGVVSEIYESDGMLVEFEGKLFKID